MMCHSALTRTPEPTPLDWKRSPWLPTSVIRWTTEGLTASAMGARASWKADRPPDTGARSAATAGRSEGSMTRPNPMPAATPPARNTATRNARCQGFIDSLVLPRRRFDLDRQALAAAEQFDVELRLPQRRQHVPAELQAIHDRLPLERDEDVMLLQTGLFCDRASLHFGDKDALVLL